MLYDLTGSGSISHTATLNYFHNPKYIDHQMRNDKKKFKINKTAMHSHMSSATTKKVEAQKNHNSCKICRMKMTA